MRNRTDWIQTYTKKKFFPLEPDPTLIDIEDIAHSLAMQCRFNGHSREFYSVAQHSVLMAEEFYDLAENGKTVAKYALLHDASEAYLSDIPAPIKHLLEFEFYRQAEARLQSMIFVKFGLDEEPPSHISNGDKGMLVAEALSLEIMYPTHADWTMPQHGPFVNYGIKCWSPKKAEKRFLEFYAYLFSRG